MTSYVCAWGGVGGCHDVHEYVGSQVSHSQSTVGTVFQNTLQSIHYVCVHILSRHNNNFYQYKSLIISFSGVGKKVSDYNLPREYLRRYFPQRRCFCFPRPVADKTDLRNMDSVPVERIDREFLQVCQVFRDVIYRESPVKAIHGQPMDGNSKYRTLVVQYTYTFNVIQCNLLLLFFLFVFFFLQYCTTVRVHPPCKTVTNNFVLDKEGGMGASRSRVFSVKEKYRKKCYTATA